MPLVAFSGGHPMPPIIEAESTLTDRYQTTRPEPVRRALTRGKRDRLRYTVLTTGEVVLARADAPEDTRHGALLGTAGAGPRGPPGTRAGAGRGRRSRAPTDSSHGPRKRLVSAPNAFADVAVPCQECAGRTQALTWRMLLRQLDRSGKHLPSADRVPGIQVISLVATSCRGDRPAGRQRPRRGPAR